MYSEYFGLEEMPFSIAPDPRYLYLSNQHREALAHLVYGINSDGGFVLLTGEVGTGKTTVCRCLLEQIPENTEIAFILNPKLTAEELLATICDEFGISYPEGNTSIKVFIDLINVYLLNAHSREHKTVLIIDEAQNLSVSVLEQLRLLTNLETNKHKLLQIILLGQPELKKILSQPELRQLSQRITARYHLGPLSRKDVASYVNYRLSVAGLRSQVFPSPTIEKLSQLSGGIPRLINILCDRALLGAFVQGRHKVDRATLSKAAREVFGPPLSRDRKISLWLLFCFVFAVMAGVVLIPSYYTNNDSLIVTGNGTTPSQEETILWPLNQPRQNSKGIAYQALFHQWEIEYDVQEHGSACQHAQRHQLRCLHRQGSLGSLQRYNRPSVLTLFDDKGNEFYAALTSLSEKTATFTIGSEIKTVGVKSLASQWLGAYTLIWKTPPGYEGDMKQGDQGAGIQWLDRQLSFIKGQAPRDNENAVFDDVLLNQVREFQRTKGLIPDGIAGTHTIIRLNTITDSGVPVLTSKEVTS
jgi:general secretion pathway protein A